LQGLGQERRIGALFFYLCNPNSVWRGLGHHFVHEFFLKMARLTGLEPVILSPVVAFYVVLLPLLPWFRQLWRQKAMVAGTQSVTWVPKGLPLCFR